MTSLRKAVGRNTATSVAVVATTARPISLAASSAAWSGVLPMRRWRMMFSISTMASSTSTPITSASDSRVTMLSVKPIRCMHQEGRDAPTAAAPRPKSAWRASRAGTGHTTSTVSSAPSYSSGHRAVVVLLHGVDVVVGLVNATPRVVLGKAADGARTALATAISPAPLLRMTSKPTTGLPSSSVIGWRLGLVSLTRAIWSRRMRRPSGQHQVQRGDLGHAVDGAEGAHRLVMPPMLAAAAGRLAAAPAAAGATRSPATRSARPCAPGRVRPAPRG